MNPSEMTNPQIDEALAVKMGWQLFEGIYKPKAGLKIMAGVTEKRYIDKNGAIAFLHKNWRPTEDLNQVRVVENEKITCRNKEIIYEDCLYQVLDEVRDYPVIHATARQKCEALVLLYCLCRVAAWADRDMEVDK